MRDADRAVESALKELPRAFPEPIAASITDGLRRRLRLINAWDDAEKKTGTS
jgi:hypothetical protein